MKKLVTLAGIVFVLFCTQLAFGQFWQTMAKTEVPFEFVMGGTVLPAGTYDVRLDPQTQTVSLYNLDNSLSAIAPVHNIYLSSDYAHSTKLVFAFDGQRHVLHQFELGGDNHIHDVIHGPEIADLAAIPST